MIQQPVPYEAAKPVNYVNYIESSGTQYIDTGFKPNYNTRVVVDFEPAVAYSSIKGIFGTRDTNSPTAPLMFVLWNSGSSAFRSDYFGTNNTLSVPALQVRQMVDKNKNVTTIGSVSTTNTAATGQCTNNLYLFCANAAGTANYFSNYKMYSCQVYDNGTLIRNYWPCLDVSGVACLYDKVSKEYVYNGGTGNFTSGGAL